jgi:hypothetical protein
MKDWKVGRLASIAVVLLLLSGAAFGASSNGQWSGTVASVSGDDLTLVGVRDHFRIAGGVTELFSGRSLSAKDLAPGSSVTLRVGVREADGRFRADRVAVQSKNPLALTGAIDRVASDRRHVEVHGVEIEIDARTAFAGRGPSGALRSARDLRAGETVRVTLVSTTAGTLRAAEISPSLSVAEPDEDQELKGTVTAISDTAWTVDTTVFTITDQTVFVGDPGIGDFVEVQFHVDVSGNSVADRIEKEDAPDAEVEFMGIVEAIGDTSWTISGQVVGIDASTKIIGSPVVGDNVEVEARKAPDGTLTAIKIQKENAEEQEVEFQGTVEAIGDTSWTISGQVVGIDASTQILGDPKVGDKVEVKANKAPDGSLTARRIKKEDNGGQGGDDQGDDHGNDQGSGNNTGNNTGNNSGNNSGNDNEDGNDQGQDVHSGQSGGSDDSSGHD